MNERGSRLPLIVLAGALVVIFHGVLLGEVFFWGLPALQSVPWRTYAFSLLRAGQLPLWNPYNGAGAPLLANYQSALLYPPNWAGLVLPVAWAMSITAVMHLFIAGWGMWAFTGRLGVPSLGRGVSALAYGLTSYLIARLGTYPTISAAAWIPWMLWAIMGVLRYARRGDVGWLALLTALQLLAGHAQTTWYGLVLAGIFALWHVVRYGRRQWRRLGLVMAGILLGAGIAALQLLATAELLRWSQRADGVDYEFTMNFSYVPARLLNLLSPNIFGNPSDGSYVTEGAFFEDAVYIGLLPLVAALAAVVSWARRTLHRDKPRAPYFASVPFWLTIAVAGVVLALGRYSPIFPFLYRYVPTFSLFQAPVRWHILTVFSLSVLAGIGVSGAWGRGYRLFFGTRLAIAGCLGAAALAVLASSRLLPSDFQGNEGVQVLVRAVVATGLLGALAGTLTLTQPEPESYRYCWWAGAVLIVVAADLTWAAQGLNPTIPPDFYDARIANDNHTLRSYWPKELEESVKFGTYLRFDDYRVAVEQREDLRTSGLSDLNLLDRAFLLNNFDPLLIAHFAEYVELVEAHPPRRSTLLQAAGVNGVYRTSGEIEMLNQTTARAWFVAEVCEYVDLNGQPSPMLLDARWQPYLLAILKAESAAESLDCSAIRARGTRDAGEVLTLQDDGNAVTLTVHTEQGSWLVLADTWYPGWEASVDGSPVPIERANLAFRAIYIPAETQTVRFEYRPGWLLPGALVSISSILVLIVLLPSKNPATAVE